MQRVGVITAPKHLADRWKEGEEMGISFLAKRPTRRSGESDTVEID